MSVCGKNPTAFQGTRKRERRIAKGFKSFIYLLKCRNLQRTAIVNYIDKFSVAFSNTN